MDSIIFDVDGTLWDSTEIVAQAWTWYLQTREHMDITLNFPTVDVFVRVSFFLILPDSFFLISVKQSSCALLTDAVRQNMKLY